MDRLKKTCVVCIIGVGITLNAFAAKNDGVKTIPFVESLISKMTLEEKVGQMTQVPLEALGKGIDTSLVINFESARKAIKEYHVGSAFNTSNNSAWSPEAWSVFINQLQSIACTESRLSIPVIYGIDGMHGATYTKNATMFPQQIAQAATWNRSLVRQMAEVTAADVRASSIPWNFSPDLDLGIDSRWARLWETFGEDPYLTTQMALEAVRGYQGESLADSTHVALCLKHFIGYSAAGSGKDRSSVSISDIALREYHLPAFTAAIEQGASSVMLNSGLVNGVPGHSSYDLITKLLKEELGFEGVVVTDWADIANLHGRDRIAASNKEAIKIAINAGVDISMEPYDYQAYCRDLIALVREGEVAQSRIDDAVRRILTLKYKLGLFNWAPNVNRSGFAKVGTANADTLSYKSACEAITLLKNECDILPLKKGSRILVTGPNANSMRTLNGGWTYSWQGDRADEFMGHNNTILEAVQKEFGVDKVTYSAGLEYVGWPYWEEKNVDISSVLVAAKNVDYILLCLGENSYTEAPGNLNDLSISKNQEQLVLELSKLDKPLILVLNQGRPRIISSFEPKLRAIIHTYLCGNMGADALADILSGDVNPSGKLPYTYPRYNNSLGVYYSKYCEEINDHQFNFGFGLSYTSFTYSDLKVSTSSFSDSDTLKVSVTVTNTGTRVGKEVVQLYSSDLYASFAPDLKRLRRFEKIELNPNESQQVTFLLTARDLAFVNSKGEWVSEAGDFNLKINSLIQKVALNQTVKFNK